MAWRSLCLLRIRSLLRFFLLRLSLPFYLLSQVHEIFDYEACVSRKGSNLEACEEIIGILWVNLAIHTYPLVQQSAFQLSTLSIHIKNRMDNSRVEKSSRP